MNAVRRIAVVAWWIAAVAGATPRAPEPVSPGTVGGAPVEVDTTCPTFSWTAVAAPQDGVELAVYATPDRSAAERRAEPELVLHVALPAGATSWTPAAAQCLRSPGGYGWAIGGRDATGAIAWSAPALFKVAGLASRPERDPLAQTARPLAAVGMQAPAVSERSPAPSGLRPESAPIVIDPGFYPPPCIATTAIYSDVPADHPYCAWIQQISIDDISKGCGGGRYCPDQPVTRAQLAMFLERAMRGTADWRPVQAGDIAVAPPATSSTTTVAGSTSIAEFPSITVGADGLGIVAFQDETPAVLKVAHCEDVACDRVTVHVVDSAANSGYRPSIVIGVDGTPLIAYVAYPGGSGYALRAAHCADPVCSSALVTTLDTDISGYVPGINAAIAGDGRPIIAYNDTGASRIKVAHCANSLCTAATLTVPQPSAVQRAVGMVVGWDGMAILFFRDDTLVAGRAGRCSDFDCTSFAGVGTWDATHDVDYIAPVIGNDGLPLVAYFDYTGKDLWAVHCSSATCDPADLKTRLDGASIDTGRYSSIAIGADGLALVSYYDGTNGDLKVAHCADSNCSSASLQTLDSAFSAGVQTSITIGVDGFGLIAHQEAFQQDIRVTHCSNAACAPFFRRR